MAVHVTAVSVMDSSCHDSSMAVCVTIVHFMAVSVTAVHVTTVCVLDVWMLVQGLSVLGLFLSDFFPATTFDFLSDSN